MTIPGLLFQDPIRQAIQTIGFERLRQSPYLRDTLLALVPKLPRIEAEWINPNVAGAYKPEEYPNEIILNMDILGSLLSSNPQLNQPVMELKPDTGERNVYYPDDVTTHEVAHSGSDPDVAPPWLLELRNQFERFYKAPYKGQKKVFDDWVAGGRKGPTPRMFFDPEEAGHEYYYTRNVEEGFSQAFANAMNWLRAASQANTTNEEELRGLRYSMMERERLFPGFGMIVKSLLDQPLFRSHPAQALVPR